MTFLTEYNGMKFSTAERSDAENFYIKFAYKEYLMQMKVENEKDRKVDTLEDPDFAEYMAKNHPRWFELAHKYEFTPEMVNIKTENVKMSDLA